MRFIYAKEPLYRANAKAAKSIKKDDVFMIYYFTFISQKMEFESV